MPDKYEIYIDESGQFGDWHTSIKKKQPDNVRLIGGLLVPTAVAAQENEDLKFRNALQKIKEEYFPGETKITGIHISEFKGDPQKRPEISRKMAEVFKQMKGVQVVFIYDLTTVDLDKNRPGLNFSGICLFA